ncbi:MAG: 2-hydroxyacyl-CoA dehydratase family protein [Syntrophobacterales bacterium]|nr:2-hydroxyacyl-CoA dehydratase family protein [Syntrophobacterales bacterium]
MKLSEELLLIAKDPYGYAETLKAEKKIVGTLCSYTPEEIIIATGAHPFRLFGSGQKARLADAHLQSYCCSLARGVLEDALSGRLDFLEGIVFAHTCDTMQRLSDICRINKDGFFHLDLILPAKLNTESARSYFRDVLEIFRKDLGAKLGVEIADSDLRKAISAMNRIRKSFTRIYELINKNPSIINGEELYILNRAAMIMDKKRLADLVEDAVVQLSSDSREAPDAGAPLPKRIFLEGGVCNYPDIYNIIEEAGGAIAGDNLCTGFRYFNGPVDEDNPDPLMAIADRYMKRIVCPAKHAGIADRGERLVEMVVEKRAQGVIFFFLKFCDPHAFDYPYLQQVLEKAGIPSLMLEVDDPLQAGGQLQTRVEAFIEMI